MSLPTIEVPLELHLLSPKESMLNVELLYAIAHYHFNYTRIVLHHIVNIGKMWLDGSTCSRALVSLPYLDGPAIENLNIDNTLVKCFWLIPITDQEAVFAKARGIEALEQLFERNNVIYLDPDRSSVV